MREILFRGKTTKKDGNKAFNNIWVEGDLVHAGISGIYIHPQANTFVVDNELAKLVVMHEVIPETVGQFTGLTDKNGKKIFEDDIIACKNYDEELVVEGVVRYGKFNCSCCDGVYGWYIDGGDIRKLDGWMVDDSNTEVIGNIHDNPELLQE